VQRGNLQDAINTYTQTGERFPERRLLRFFKGTCEAVRAMHTYRSPKPSPGSSSSQPPPGPGIDDGHEESDNFPHPEGDAEGGYSYEHGPRTIDAARVPLVARNAPHLDDGDVIFDDDQDTAQNGSGELVPYAHRDLKPG
jgi:serine/threonine kinase 16